MTNISKSIGVETEKKKPRRAINKSTKKAIVFDEKKRKEFLTGFRKRKDERRKKWNEKVERNLKEEIKRIKEQTRAKIERSKGNKSNVIVPEVAHLINSDLASTSTTEFDTASVTVTTLDNLSDIAAPWRVEQKKKEEEENDDDESEE